MFELLTFNQIPSNDIFGYRHGQRQFIHPAVRGEENAGHDVNDHVVMEKHKADYLKFPETQAKQK